MSHGSKAADIAPIAPIAPIARVACIARNARIARVAQGFHSACRLMTSTLVIGLALGAVGCSAFDRPNQPVANYLLAPSPQAPLAGEKLGSVMVARFSAVPPFDDRPFLYRTSDGTWRFDNYAGFIANPSDMVSACVARALEESGRCGMVGVEGVALRFDFSFEGVIEAFYADFFDASAPKAVVVLRGYLLDRRDGAPKLVAQVGGRGTAAIDATDPGAVANALSSATSSAIAELLGALPPALPKRTADPAVAGETSES